MCKFCASANAAAQLSANADLSTVLVQLYLGTVPIGDAKVRLLKIYILTM